MTPKNWISLLDGVKNGALATTGWVAFGWPGALAFWLIGFAIFIGILYFVDQIERGKGAG